MIGPRNGEKREASIRRRLGFGSGRPVRMSVSLVMAVLAAATFISFAVTSVSTYSVLDGLEEDPRRRLPMLVDVASERLDLWFAQRRNDLATFSGSAGLVMHAERLGGRGSERARREIRAHLDGLRDDYPAFESFFVLDPVGELVVLSGPGPVPTLEMRRELVLGSLHQPGMRYRPHERDHVVSAPLRRGAFGLSLHALVPAESMATALQPVDLPLGGALHVVDADGHQLATAGQGIAELPQLPDLRDPQGPPELAQLDSEGPLVMVAAARYGQSGWRVVSSFMVEWDPATAPRSSNRAVGLKGGAMLFFTLLAVLFSSAILRPIQAFQEATRVLAERDLGAPSAQPDDSASHEVGMLTRTFLEVRGHLRRYQDELARKRREIAAANDRLRAQNEQLRHANRILEKLSMTDELTGLFNQRYFREHLPIETKRASRTGDPLTLVLFDIDDFKKLNDTYGHASGDAVLQHIAGVIGEQVRDMDLLARYGGEEFVLLASQTPLDGAVALAEKIRLAVRNTRIRLGDAAEPVRVTVSAGAAAFAGDERELFESADAALYRAKSFGKDRVVASRAGDRPATPSTPRLRPSPSRRGRRAS